jgi:C4-type Zn-finger protein
MKTYIVSMGYSYLGTESKEVAIGLLEAKVLNQEYVKDESCYIYIPEEKDITIKVVDSSMIRPLTNKEKENKAIAVSTQMQCPNCGEMCEFNRSGFLQSRNGKLEYNRYICINHNCSVYEFRIVFNKALKLEEAEE